MLACGDVQGLMLKPLPSLMRCAERTVALLAFEDVGASPVADLMDIAQRQKTASELNAAILASQGQVCAGPPHLTPVLCPIWLPDLF